MVSPGVKAEDTLPLIGGGVVGAVFDYEAQAGETLARIGSRFGVSQPVLASQNGLKPNAKLLPGQKIAIDNQHIVPLVKTAGLLINIPQRMLFYFSEAEEQQQQRPNVPASAQNALQSQSPIKLHLSPQPAPDVQSDAQVPPSVRLVAAYPVGLGMPTWPTPQGMFKVLNKSDNKTWIVPLSIQEEMRKKGQEVQKSVPPGPKNPLGKYWIGLSMNSIGIHGTLAPASIYLFKSHGCIRLHPDDIEVLFSKVVAGTQGRIIYSPVLMTETNGRIFIEVHPDSYNRGSVSMAALEKLAHQNAWFEQMDWVKAAEVLKLKEGIARDVTLITP